MKTIRIDPVSRIEGHARITVFADRSSRIEKIFFQSTEFRGYEKILTGLPAEDVPRISSTICGICRAVHFIASLKAVDSIYGVSPPEPAEKLRQLVLYANIIEDHAASLLLLALPDLVNEGDVIASFKKVGTRKIKDLLNKRSSAVKIIEILAGRLLHPVAAVPGGWAKKPDEHELGMLNRYTMDLLTLGLELYELFSDLLEHSGSLERFPSKHMHFMTLRGEKTDFYSGDICVLNSSKEEVFRIEPSNYEDVVAEDEREYSYSKDAYVSYRGDRMDVITGVLGRFSAGFHEFDLSSELYSQIESEIDLNTIRPEMAYLLRALEIVHCAEAMRDIIENIDLSGGIVNRDYKIRREGIGAVEAPRGTLIHHYTTDARGFIRKVNIITPTQFNINSLNVILNQHFRGRRAGKGLAESIERMVRTFDPCIACSTHSINGKSDLDVRIVRL
ncbi:Ni/Fe hydrogenase subunit alpha [Geoglobus acetivorans]|uniref:Methylviologen-reducing hydrogenase, subunit alpha (MvhA) n=1 Tax=Geoglobus acetivorans TaxID=565033 RepID=A0A0A7GFQ7_GEOAI|nr:methylviologen-reducing hydrogenase, subunit alpha (MvhA) [Geoglobus acetivorans]